MSREKLSAAAKRFSIASRDNLCYTQPVNQKGTRVMDIQVTQVIATLAANRIHTWNEDATWRYMRELFPNASDQHLQQIADRVQWELI